MPGWCQGFSLDGGSGVRALKVIQHGNRPGLIYNIGIDVKKGRGRYIDTCMVTFAPRYLLDNKSTYKLAFVQREFAKGREPGKRSQLWRMTDTGMLCHEGSSVPHNPHKPPPRSADSCMILDIAGLAAVTDNRYEPLMLRKPDRRRSTTQTWSFRDGSEGDELPVTEQDLRKFKNPDTEQELEVLVKLEGGIGLSLVNKVPEELVFACLTRINVHYTQLSASQVLELSVQDIQEKLLLKLLSFFGYDQSESEVEKYDENLHEKAVEQGGAQKRYYFENLKISVPQIKLSVFTSNKLPLDLQALKSTLGFPLIRFEDAVIDLDPFTRVHPYETQEFIINDILKHFQEELLSQAARILGSVDFLGNPMGLLNDVSEGVTGLIRYGNVGGLIRNVTHGVSNSAAKA
ncbi:vacuolar protein sorting-associated protein 13d isoform x1 [Limosa lapponica baueri]|uniref:Vacuolar protein sorting-associated protein 13d isoform x1 n=1 Tax=Limosa lapponica baueri TaxID=1758121 RepID=A0A2I0TBC5_LIMLA|nr:vacuolar protein sorting-associated protein 13d isoform x1 [Limosa lapponica baueri]